MGIDELGDAQTKYVAPSTIMPDIWPGHIYSLHGNK